MLRLAALAVLVFGAPARADELERIAAAESAKFLDSELVADLKR